MNKFRVTLTEKDLNDLVLNQGRDRVIDKIYNAYKRGHRQKIMAKHRAWDRLSHYEKYIKTDFKLEVDYFNPAIPKLKGS